jgi:hypothetical protein
MASDPMWHDLGGVSNDAYEWLYFDVLDQATQAHVSIDFLAPNPFDPRVADPAVHPRDRVGVITCISRPQQPGIEIAFGGDRNQLRLSNGTGLSIGNSTVTRRAGPGGLPIFEIELSSTAFDSSRKVTGEFTFESVAAEWSVPGTRFYEAADDPTRYHRWIVHAPRARTSGHLVVEGGPEGRIKLDLSGHGYHDHNLGTVSLAATVQRWFWARGSDSKHTVIAAHLLPKAAAAPSGRWLESVVYTSSDDRNLVGATGDENVFDLRNKTRGSETVEFPALVEVRTQGYRRQSVALSFKHQAMAIDGHPGYLRRYVDLSMSTEREQPSVLTAVAEDIVFP